MGLREAPREGRDVRAREQRLNLVLSIAREEREQWLAFDEFEREMREMDWEREKEKEGPEM
jgi:hypothetical protein